MFWTVYVVFGLGFFLLTRRMREYVDSRRKSPPLTPRTIRARADIGQVLPADVLEHVMSYCDPITLSTSTMVNKHWYYSSQQIRDKVFRALITHLDDLINKIRAKTPEFDPAPIRSSNFNMLNKEERIRDQLFAQSLGKNLIVADLLNARELKNAIVNYNEAQNNGNNMVDGLVHIENLNRQSQISLR